MTTIVSSNQRLISRLREQPQQLHRHNNTESDLSTSPIRFLVLIPAFFFLWLSVNSSGQSSSYTSLEFDNMAVNVNNNNNYETDGVCENLRYSILEEGVYGGSPFTRYGAFCGNDDHESAPLTIEQWTQSMLGTNPNCRQGLTMALQTSSYPAYFFETKGTTRPSSRQTAFEFVLVDTPLLKSFAESNASPRAFLQHLQSCQGAACSFSNLGGDARLVAPQHSSGGGGSSDDDYVSYSHLAAFVRKAPSEQVDELWRLVAFEYSKIQGLSQSVWLSTDGTGVPWLHVRLDSRPKYYSYRPFANIAG